jgi:hypothetical protein
MEKIMTKTVQDRELQDSELDSVSGGEGFGPVVQGMIDLMKSTDSPPDGLFHPGTGGGGTYPRNLRAA